MDEVHLWRSLSYVERNPVRAKMVRVPWRHRWSSAARHCGGKDTSGLLDLSAWFKEWRVDRWKQELHRPEDAALVRRMRRCLHTGRPLASDRFIGKLEVLVRKRPPPLLVELPRKKGRKTGG